MKYQIPLKETTWNHDKELFTMEWETKKKISEKPNFAHRQTEIGEGRKNPEVLNNPKKWNPSICIKRWIRKEIQEPRCYMRKREKSKPFQRYEEKPNSSKQNKIDPFQYMTEWIWKSKKAENLQRLSKSRVWVLPGAARPAEGRAEFLPFPVPRPSSGASAAAAPLQLALRERERERDRERFWSGFEGAKTKPFFLENASFPGKFQWHVPTHEITCWAQFALDWFGPWVWVLGSILDLNSMAN